MKPEYKLIPLTDITDQAREIAVAWIEGYEPMGFDLQQKHKLASDIMNYAAAQVPDLLDRYTTFLQKEGYLDTDATLENPTAIDLFLQQQRKEKPRK
jgi:hypothetical protein